MTNKQDMNRNPTGKGGFQERPQDRAKGNWKKEDTPRYKLEQMMKLPENELQKVLKDKTRPMFEIKLAKAITEGDWKTIREITHEVYGTPRQSVDVTSGGEAITPVLIEWAKPDAENTDSA